MNSRKIFLDRLIRGWKYQYGVIRSIADWTIILYLIIPANIIFIFIYRSWWIETPSWIEFIPLLFMFFLIYLLSWSGVIRTFVQEADKIYLVKNARIFLGMRKYGYVYSLFMQFLHTGFTFLILLPFLRNQYLLNWPHITSILFYFIALSTTIILVKFYLRKIETKFKKIAAGMVAFIALGSLSQLIYLFWEKGLLLLVFLCGGIMLASAIIQSLKAIKSISSIDHDIDMEQERKTKNIELIFSLSYEIEKPVVSKRKKPLLYRHSKRIFKNRTELNGFIELFIKVFIRNSSYWRGYFQIISVTAVALIIIPPLWIKAIIFIGYLIMMNSWLSLIWDKIAAANPLSKKYREMPFYFSARKRTVLTLFILAIIIASILIANGFLLYSYFESKFGIFQN